MNRSLSPSLLLEAPTVSVRRHARPTRVHWLDYAFFTLVLIMICGGALFMLELGSSQSAGHESTLGQLMSEGSIWLAVAVKKISYYGAAIPGERGELGIDGGLHPNRAHRGPSLQPLGAAPLAFLNPHSVSDSSGTCSSCRSSECSDCPRSSIRGGGGLGSPAASFLSAESADSLNFADAHSLRLKSLPPLRMTALQRPMHIIPG